MSVQWSSYVVNFMSDYPQGRIQKWGALGTPKLHKGGKKVAHVRQILCVLVLNSYPDPPSSFLNPVSTPDFVVSFRSDNPSPPPHSNSHLTAATTRYYALGIFSMIGATIGQQHPLLPPILVPMILLVWPIDWPTGRPSPGD